MALCLDKDFPERKLRNGSKVPELAECQTLKLVTRCPEKWVSVDMETGEVWIGSTNGWIRASNAECKEAAGCLNATEKCHAEAV